MSTTENDLAAPSNEQSTAADRRYVFHSWSAQELISPLPIAGGEGAWFWDNEGNRYLDFASQLVNLNLGHQHPRMVAAIKAQADVLCTVAPPFANDVRTEAARLITEHAPGDLDRVFFTNGGAEANENAVRMARLHTGRQKVLSTYRSYHGATSTAITLTGEPRRWASEPGTPGVVHFFGPYTYRSSFGATTDEEERERALEHLAQVIQMEGGHTIAAIVLESVVGTNGVLVPPEGYLAGVRELCDEHGILLIADEVMVGFGRVGEWFAVDRWGVVPDLLTFAKGVNSGYVPLGGVLISDAVAATFAERPYPGGLTYSGHPLACATAVESISIFTDDDIVGRSRRLGEEVIRPALRDIAARHPSVGEVRGLGCFFAIELVRDRGTREPLVPFNAAGAEAAPMTELMGACKSRGVWPFSHFNRLHVAPPLVISDEDLRAGLAAIDEALDVADAHVS
ncbi:aspartate aminotransferase family protein [Dermatobacter hominis]|uniref:aspartate aminotransferase family protein n=1 Tax=Dermatobacter hominis TaxID=2884263 RepID=UPI001D11A143|nr:aspartate aminotransferase family protein [Dermatobacter hominis]UDY35357.1 aspartate aminotransferase family protein [Dermatobacter hominis]